MSSKKIYILGESHTRSFCFRQNIIPIFLNSGKKVNFQKPNEIIKKVFKVWESGEIKNNDVLGLYLGEPDARFQLGYKWYPHYQDLKSKKLRVVEPFVNKVYLNKALSTYENILEKLHEKGIPHIHVLSPTGSYPAVLKPLAYFNKMMKAKCEAIPYVTFIDIFSHSLNKGKVKTHFLPPKGLAADPIHLNSKISDILVQELKNEGTIDNVKNYKRIKGNYNSLDVKNKFKKDPKFGSFTIK